MIVLDILTMLDYNSDKGHIIYAVGNYPIYVNVDKFVEQVIKSIRVCKEDKKIIEFEVTFDNGLYLNVVANRTDVQLWYTPKDNTKNGMLFSFLNPETLSEIDNLKPKNL